MAMITTTTEHLRNMLEDAAEIASLKTMVLLGKHPATITQSQAGKLYGRNTIARWVKEGLIDQIQDGDNAVIRYDVTKLAAVAKTSNRHTYLTVHER